MTVINENLEKIMKPGSERNIISICLKNPNQIITIQNEEILPEYFLVEGHRYIYTAIQYLFHKKQTPTPMAIMEVLQDKHAKGKVEELGGLEYLDVLADAYIPEDNLYIFCQKVKQAYTRYKLIEACDLTKAEVMSEKMEVLNPIEILQTHESKIAKLTTNIQKVSDVYKMGSKTEEILEKRAEHPNEIPGLETGWTKFDYYTNGGKPGDLIMVCARSKTGKSALLNNWATSIGVIDKIPVLYIDTEMNEREQEDRILAMLTGIPHKEIISGMYVLDTEAGKGTDKRAKLKEAIQKLKEGEYYHIYMPSFTIEKINALAHRFKIQNNIQALFFDYLKFPANQLGALKQAQEWQMLGFIASGLKDLGGTLKIPVYSACQENRSNPKSTEKDETNIGGSDRILQLATTLIFLYNKTDEQIAKEGIANGNQQLYIAYQRNGQSDCPPINVMYEKHIIKQREV